VRNAEAENRRLREAIELEREDKANIKKLITRFGWDETTTLEVWLETVTPFYREAQRKMRETT
jgi:hypothetical protein